MRNSYFNIIMLSMCFLFLSCSSQQPSSIPEPNVNLKDIEGECFFRIGDDISRLEARKITKDQATINALENYIRFIYSETLVINNISHKHLVKSISTGVVKNLTILSQKEEEQSVFIRIKATVDTYEINKLIKNKVKENEECIQLLGNSNYLTTRGNSYLEINDAWKSVSENYYELIGLEISKRYNLSFDVPNYEKKLFCPEGDKTYCVLGVQLKKVDQIAMEEILIKLLEFNREKASKFLTKYKRLFSSYIDSNYYKKYQKYLKLVNDINLFINETSGLFTEAKMQKKELKYLDAQRLIGTIKNNDIYKLINNDDAFLSNDDKILINDINILEKQLINSIHATQYIKKASEIIDRTNKSMLKNNLTIEAYDQILTNLFSISSNYSEQVDTIGKINSILQKHFPINDNSQLEQVKDLIKNELTSNLFAYKLKKIIYDSLDNNLQLQIDDILNDQIDLIELIFSKLFSRIDKELTQVYPIRDEGILQELGKLIHVLRKYKNNITDKLKNTFITIDERYNTLIAIQNILKSNGYIFFLSGEFLQGNIRIGLRKTKILNPFYICNHEVTISEFEEYVNTICKGSSDNDLCYANDNNLSNWNIIDGELLVQEDKNENYPMNCISWEDSALFIKWLNDEFPLGENFVYRFCTEAEWEYSARCNLCSHIQEFNSRKLYYLCSDDRQYQNNFFTCGNDIECLNEIACYNKVSNQGSCESRTKKHSQCSLFDMHGNVSEWVSNRKESVETESYINKGCSFECTDRNDLKISRSSFNPKRQRKPTIGLRLCISKK